MALPAEDPKQRSNGSGHEGSENGQPPTSNRAPRQRAKSPIESPLWTWRGARKRVQHRYPRLWQKLRDYKGMTRDLGAQVREQGPRALAAPLGHMVRQRRHREPRGSRQLWLDLGDFGELVEVFAGGPFQDHGMGLLRTILHEAGVLTDLASTRTVTTWKGVAKQLRGYDTLIMNVRSYNFPIAVEAARLFKQLNPGGCVITGGMHAAVSPEEMAACEHFDKICTGPGEGLIVDLIRDPDRFPRVFEGKGAQSMADWPVIDRTLWPKPASLPQTVRFCWPLEPGLGWGPPPVASILTSRVCPWQCSFCNENSYIPNMGRRPVDMVIDELNELDETYGVGSVVIHDSMFFQNPRWLAEWLEKYPKRANKIWPYWAAGRADTVKQWPELFERLVRETNWNSVSIGFESGSDRVLRVLNKQVTAEENRFTIDLVNRIGDEQEAAGEEPVRFWSNVMLAIPGERPEDAFETLRMIKRMKRATPAFAYYAPYPGSALGYQIIADGKNILRGNHERNPEDEKVVGIDYEFYRDLLRGRYDEEIARGLSPEERDRQIVLHGGGTLVDLVSKA